MSVHEIKEDIMLPISVCIIGKNEEKFIEGCLQHLAEYDWEIIFVDTGSTDKTCEIALKYTNNVYDFAWIKDFSAARNFATSKASRNWILSIDCDEYLEPFDVKSLQQKLRDYPDSIGQINILNLQTNQDEILHHTVSRLYQKRYYHWENPIHEQLVRKDQLTASAFPSELSALHYGYALSDNETIAKTHRNLDMLLSTLDAGNDNPYYYYKTGCEYVNLKDYDTALKYFEATLEYNLDPSLFWVKELIYQYGVTLISTDNAEIALGLEAVYDDFSSVPEYIYILALIYAANGLFAQALSMLNKVVNMKEECHIVTGVTSYVGYFQLGNVCHHLKKDDLAKVYLKKASNYEPALKLLKKIERTT